MFFLFCLETAILDIFRVTISNSSIYNLKDGGWVLQINFSLKLISAKTLQLAVFKVEAKPSRLWKSARITFSFISVYKERKPLYDDIILQNTFRICKAFVTLLAKRYYISNKRKFYAHSLFTSVVIIIWSFVLMTLENKMHTS